MIRSLCQKGILLSQGNLIREGIIETIITEYLSRSSVDDKETAIKLYVKFPEDYLTRKNIE